MLDSDTYERYRQEFEKEDTLLNNRLGWLLLSQVILFAAVRFPGPPLGEVVMEIIPWVAIAICLLVLGSVIAAIANYLRCRNQLLKHYPREDDSDHKYPQLHRGPYTLFLGFVAPVALPLVFLAAWVYLLLVTGS